MRRNLKKLGCAMLCTCLLLVNTPGSMSYAENTEQYATNTDAAYTTYADVPEVEGTTRTATNTDVEDIDTASDTTAGNVEDIYALSVMAADLLLYAESPDVPEGAYSIEINSQDDWDNLVDGTLDDENPIVIILNADITLTKATTLDPDSKDLRIYGNGDKHSIDISGCEFTLEADTVTIDNVHFKNGTVQVSASDSSKRISITNCDFSDCPAPCIYSNGDACPAVSFSDCNMDNCGLLFRSEQEDSRVSFSDITATNCTGTVLGKPKTDSAGSSYIIEKISGCNLSTSESGITAIEHDCSGAVGEITGCTIAGFDMGIKLSSCNAGPVSDIDTITISDTTITDCITGVDISSLSAYENAMISNLTMEARKDASEPTVGYTSKGYLTNKNFGSVNYNFGMMPQIKACKITGFDTGIRLERGQAVVSDCEISDCASGIIIENDTVAILDTTLRAGAATAYSTGITSNSIGFLIDCDIEGFNVGSKVEDSNNTTIISCKFENKDTNLIGSTTRTAVYDTSFIGGETSVTLPGGTSHFYDCVVKGDAATQKGFSVSSGSSSVYIYSMERPYTTPMGGYYDDLKGYSDRTVNNGKSEIFNCETGIDSASSMYIADTHIYNCGTGIKSTSNTYSFGNNVIEDCDDGIIANYLAKNKNNAFTDEDEDIIRNCSNNGLDCPYFTAYPAEWNHRLEIYECGNYGINTTGTLDAIIDIHDCTTGIYMTGSANVYPASGSKIYNNSDWNVYDSLESSYPHFTTNCSVLTLTDGKVYSEYASIGAADLYSDDSVYYLAKDDDMCYVFQVDNLHGTVFFDADDSGYTIDRKVAALTNPDIASQMFAKKEGFIISTVTEEKNGYSSTYAVFAEGCDVTYDVTTNGGDTFDGEKLSAEEIKDGKLKRISYPKDDDIDFSSHDASKDGYEFVGWNTDKDATEGLEPDTLTAGTEDITLYAIYKKTVDINYHTYNADSDYKDAVTFYNNEEEKEHGLAAYNAGGDDTFAGYVLDEDANVSSADDLMQAGDDVTVSPDGLDVYCVYEKQGQLKYLKKDGTTLSTESKTVYQISTHTKKFEYTVKAGEQVEGFIFTGWKDEDGNSFAAGATLSTEDNDIILTPVYVEATTEGCDVTYDVTTNGGDADSFSGGETQISYLDGDDVNLTYTASKTGYEFVGWNTNQNATEKLDTLTAETEDITLYAIYKKTAYISYHTYNAALNYRTAVTFYNNQTETEHGLVSYNAGGDNTFAGYVINEDADVSSADDLMQAGDDVTVSLDGLDVYCVYEKQGQLKYLKKDGTTLSTEGKTVYQISTHTKEFEYTVRSGEKVTGFTFTGWKDEDDNSYAAGATLSTLESSVVLTPVYVEAATEGCNVTYDVTTNGGDADSFSGGETQISCLDGDDVDLNYTASKTGYEFVGWNTAQNATEGLTTLTAGTEDITLYAIYKKTVYISYHTYNAALNYRTAVTFYNNQAEIEQGLAAYNAGEDDTFVGYVLDGDANVSSADAVMAEGDTVTVSSDGLDVYCVYEKQGQLKYLKKDGTTLITERKTVYQISTHTKEFEYTVRAGEKVTGFTFTGWKDEDDNSYAAGATLSTLESSVVLTPVYVEATTEGCNVTYDVTTNGGDADSFSGGETQISCLDGDNVDLTHTASKTGYEFVGWNTAQNATEGLTTLTAGTEDITLYAIYKKTVYISYHTYNAALNYRTAVTFYNNQDEKEQGLAAYNAGEDDTFVGYVLDGDANVSSADAVMAEGDTVTVSPDGLDVYCVYEKQGQLKYLKKDGTTLSTERKTVYQISTHNKEFEYTVRAGETVEGFTFTGWKDEADNSYAAGATLSTMESSVILTPVYEENEEPSTEDPTTEEPTETPTTEEPTTEIPTTEEPTTETPTTEEPTTETPTTEAPTTETPTTEAPTTQTPTAQTPSGGPNTGDSTTPIGVMGLGILSLLGILVLSLKNKRKN